MLPEAHQLSLLMVSPNSRARALGIDMIRLLFFYCQICHFISPPKRLVYVIFVSPHKHLYESFCNSCQRRCFVSSISKRDTVTLPGRSGSVRRFPGSDVGPEPREADIRRPGPQTPLARRCLMALLVAHCRTVCVERAFS
jgi:hypothetical protein